MVVVAEETAITDELAIETMDDASADEMVSDESEEASEDVAELCAADDDSCVSAEEVSSAALDALSMPDDVSSVT